MTLISNTIVGNSHVDRHKDDYYKTPEWATRLLLQRERFYGVIWEPACGDGAIARLLPGTVVSTDLYDRGYGKGGVDFLQEIRDVNHIVTNPPYKLAQEFVEHSLECATGKVVMLLKLAFLEGQKRKPFFEKSPLRTVYVFSKRVDFGRGDEPGKGAGLLAYAWFVWEQRYTGKPMIEWI